DVAHQRVQAMVSTTDGFRLAEVDLQLRGPGEMAGTRQSGMPEFRIANLLLDSELLSLAQKEAQRFVDRSGERQKLLEALSARTRLVTVRCRVHRASLSSVAPSLYQTGTWKLWLNQGSNHKSAFPAESYWGRIPQFVPLKGPSQTAPVSLVIRTAAGI